MHSMSLRDRVARLGAGGTSAVGSELRVWEREKEEFVLKLELPQ